MNKIGCCGGQDGGVLWMMLDVMAARVMVVPAVPPIVSHTVVIAVGVVLLGLGS